jgi:hypothetical protein
MLNELLEKRFSQTLGVTFEEYKIENRLLFSFVPMSIGI